MKYEPALDGLRAIAVFAVIIYHYYTPYLPGGWVGVDIFFVLSGYLITNILRNEIGTNGRINFRFFYIKRALRLFPALGLLLLFEAARLLLLWETPYRNNILGAMGMAGLYLMNWNRAFHWLPEDQLGHTWSLSMEEQFYIFWPVILLFVNRIKPVIWLCALILLVMGWRYYLWSVGAGYDRTYNGFDTHSDGLLIGCLAAFIPHNKTISKLALNTIMLPVLAIAAIALYADHKTFVGQNVGIFLTNIFTVHIIIALKDESLFKRILSFQPFVYTGRISYGLYLWHYPIMILGARNIPDRLYFLLIPVSYVAAVLSYHLIEKRFLALKSRFETKATGAQA